MLLFSCSQILCRYIYNTVGINIKGNLNLRNASSCGRNTIQTELAKALIVPCKLTLTLYYMDINCCLIICCSREDLALLGGDGSISLNQSGCNTAHGLDRQGQRSYVQKQDIACACIACQLTTLDCCTDCNALIRVQRLVRLLSYFL